jgi:hypothetical protein
MHCIVSYNSDTIGLVIFNQQQGVGKVWCHTQE